MILLWLYRPSVLSDIKIIMANIYYTMFVYEHESTMCGPYLVLSSRIQSDR